MYKLLPFLIALSTIISGCVGYGVVKKEVTISDYSAETPHKFPCQQSCKNGLDLTDRDRLIQMYGAPNEVKQSEGTEILTFKENRSLRGLVVFPIIPIPLPLIIPAGWNGYDFYLSDGVIVSRTRYHAWLNDLRFCSIMFKKPFVGCIYEEGRLDIN